MSVTIYCNLQLELVTLNIIFSIVAVFGAHWKEGRSILAREMYGCMGHILVLMVLLRDLKGVCGINIELSTVLKMVKVGTISYSTFN